jgi:hypothetical protein
MKSLILSGLLIISFVICGQAFARTDFTGTVRAIDAGKNEFTMDGEGPGIDVGDQHYAVRVDDKTAYFGYTSIKAIEPGDEVIVQGQVMEDGNTVHATAVSEKKAEESREHD